MRCERCQGRGYVAEKRAVNERFEFVGDATFEVTIFPPCPDCHGSGIADCCGGPVCEAPE